jgi:FkbM family methyltransferase
MINRLKSLILPKEDPDLSFKKISYAQTGEDLIVDYIFTQMGIPYPTYMDIGAHHPYYLSNTALFYKKGSRGINIEPDPELFKLFSKHRLGDTNLNIGIGAEKSSVDFYIISSPTLNTFSKQEAESYIKEGNYKITDTIKVEVESIGNIINEFNGGIFPNFLNVDAEGIDELIIKSIDYNRSYPLVICVETISFSTSGNGIKNTVISEFLLQNGYLLWADTYINTIFVREDAWKKQEYGHR